MCYNRCVVLVTTQLQMMKQLFINPTVTVTCNHNTITTPYIHI